jgi:hypothetical protein
MQIRHNLVAVEKPFFGRVLLVFRLKSRACFVAVGAGIVLHGWGLAARSQIY